MIIKTKKSQGIGTAGLILVLLLFTVLVLLSFSLNHENKKQLPEPNYLGLAELGFIPNIPEHEPWEGDESTGVVAMDQDGTQYILVKDAFGRIYARKLN